MQEHKSLILALLEILTNYSDEEHILTRSQIEQYLESIYGIKVERRTLYANLKLISDNGYDISDFQENKSGYYLVDRQFEKSEADLLCHAIHSSHIIPEKDSNNLIEKLLKTQSKYQASYFKQKVYARNLRKTTNKQFFLNVEIINEAIQKQHTISFIYSRYNLDKELVPRRAESYRVSPYNVVYVNDNYYLICKYMDKTDFSHYRIDKMQNINIEDEKTKPLEEGFDPYQYAKNHIYMYGGTKQNIYLRCSNIIIDDVIDNFGKDTIMRKDDDEHFIAKIQSSEQGIIYWCLQYLKYCELLEPENLRKQLIEILDEGYNRYKKNL